MFSRRLFVRHAALLAAGTAWAGPALGRAAATPGYPGVRPPVAQRRFRSPAVEAVIAEFAQHVRDAELAGLFGNCFPYALDTAVTYRQVGGQFATFVGAGQPDAPAVLELRDSTIQVWPYLPLAPREPTLRQLLAGLVRQHTRCLLLDPYANAFYDDPTRVAPRQPADQPPPPPGVHERKWMLDSLCYPLRLAYAYWKATGDTLPFDADWRRALAGVVRTLREQQQVAGPGPYHLQRPTADALNTRPLAGYGYPVRSCGLVASAFGPSGAATRLGFSVPSNFLAVGSLRQAALMLNDLYHDDAGYAELMKLADEIAQALRQHAVVAHPTLGRVYAYEVDGYGGYALGDEAAASSLLALPYFGAALLSDPLYRQTRRLALSPANPFFYRGRAAEGLGSPRTGPGAIWPLAVALRGLTSTDPAEIRACVQQLKASAAGTGYLPESFYPDAPTQQTRPADAGANALGAEFLWKVYQQRPELLG